MRLGEKNPSLGIIVCHHSARILIPNGDPRDGFFKSGHKIFYSICVVKPIGVFMSLCLRIRPKVKWVQKTRQTLLLCRLPIEIIVTSQVHNFQKLKNISLKAVNFLATNTKVTCLSESVFFHLHISELNPILTVPV